MGINSTEVSYGFGQMGSTYQNLAAPVWPPKDHVIVAIQFLAANILTELVSETLDGSGPQFPSTSTTEATTSNYMGVTDAAASAGTSDGRVTIADVVSNLKIKKGQYVLIGQDADTLDTGLDDMDDDPANVDPIYNGPNAKGLVVSVPPAGGTYGTQITITNADGTQANMANMAGTNTLYFLDEFHGAGGTNTVGASYPTGLTIYGRWTKVTPAADSDGGIICYFGK